MIVVGSALFDKMVSAGLCDANGYFIYKKEDNIVGWRNNKPIYRKNKHGKRKK